MSQKRHEEVVEVPAAYVLSAVGVHPTIMDWRCCKRSSSEARLLNHLKDPVEALCRGNILAFGSRGNAVKPMGT